jgi:amidohydrolase
MMQKLLRFSLFTFIITSMTAAQTADHFAAISAATSKIEPKVIAWRHDFHQNPELGNREFRTADIIAKHLKSLGIEVRTKVGVTGVVGILKGGQPGPVVALRADMDALPVEEKNNLPYASKAKAMYNGKETSVMHACGHDAHVSILMGVAEILAGMKKDLKGTVKFIFQPAEEGTQNGEEGGAQLMIKEGVMENPKVDVVFGLHMNSMAEVGTIEYRPGGFFASVSDFKIVVTGKPSHGSQPWNSVDPILVSAQIVTSLQTIVSRNMNLIKDPAVLTVGSIHGGNRHNIIPEQVELIGDIRTFTPEDEQLMYNRIREVVEHTAKAAGATATVQIPLQDHYPVTFNDEALTAAMLPSLQKSAGKENVSLGSAITGAEDFSFLAQKAPGLYFRLGGMTKGKDKAAAGPHHTPQFLIDDSAFITGINALCNLVFDYMEMNAK